MALRTGMEFGNNLNEFDMKTGLSKNGIELSDDEIDNNYIDQNKANLTINGKYYDEKPLKNTIAYDIELDNSDFEF